MQSTPGLLRKPTRGIVPSTLLRLWEGQCLHKAAHAWNCAIYFASFVGGAVPPQGRPVRDFSRQGDVQPESQPEASQKPTKPLFLIARTSQTRQAEAAAWALQGVNSAAFFGTSKAIDACASQAHAWNCAIYFASFVGGAVPSQGRPQAGGSPASFSQVSTRFFQAGGCPTRKPARSQPQANQTSFFDSQKPAKRQAEA